jgi:hypothetical protein
MLMTAVPVHDGAVALPLRDWRSLGDNRLLLALAASVAMHVALVAIADRFPVHEDFLRPWDVVAPPVISFPAPPAISETPPPAPSVARTPSPGSPSGLGAPGTATAGHAKNLLNVLEENRELLALLTRKGDGAEHGPTADLPAAAFALPTAGVQVATNEHAPNIGGAPQGQLIAFANSLLPKTEAPTAERTRREVTSTMSAPKTDSGDAAANRLVRQALLHRLPAIKYCYERAIKSNPQLSGKITVQVMFDASGAAPAVALLFDGLGDPEAAECILAALRKTRTETPLGAPVTATAPYVFTVANF